MADVRSPGTHTLDVPGARICYDVRGSGPVLLLIPGGPADAGVFAAMAPLLADEFTVVTYDPRGLSRSSLDGPAQDIPVEVQCDDAQRLLSAITAAPAYVFGNSGGAVTGLGLVAGHAASVRTLVAHEPPVVELLPDSQAQRAVSEDVYETYRNAGPGPAMMMFLRNAGVGGAPPDGQAGPAPGAAHRAAPAGMGGNVELFLGHMLRQITGYRPDVTAIRRASTRVVVGCGAESGGQIAGRAAVALAGVLGVAPVEFPGGHGGFMAQPRAFAETLRRVLREPT